jgi:hypothetical protein
MQVIAKSCIADWCRTAAVAKQRRHCSCFDTTCVLSLDSEKRHQSLLWLIACKDGGWPLYVRHFFSDEVWFHLAGYGELSEYLHMTDRKFLSSPWNSPSPCQDWSVMCSVSSNIDVQDSYLHFLSFKSVACCHAPVSTQVQHLCAWYFWK